MYVYYIILLLKYYNFDDISKCTHNGMREEFNIVEPTGIINTFIPPYPQNWPDTIPESNTGWYFNNSTGEWENTSIPYY